MLDDDHSAYLSKKQIGNIAEQATLDFLLKKGYTIIVKNWRCKSGEIDLVLVDQQSLVFVEVRSRSSCQTRNALFESLNQRKQKKVRELSRIFLHLYPEWAQSNLMIRFDAVFVLINQKGIVVSIDHLVNAF